MTQFLDEYQAVRKGAGLIDAALWGVVEARGADRVGFLHNLLTQDIQGLRAGQSCEAALVTPAAKLLADLVVLAEADAHWLIAPRSRVATVMETLERYHITEDVALRDRSAAHRVLALQGPAYPDALKAVAGGPVLIAPSSLTGSPGALLIVPSARAADVEAGLLDDGRVTRISEMTLHVLRIEAGIPWYGVDMDDNTLLPETGLDSRLASPTKGCYVGQEIIARLATYGSVSRKLMGVVCEGSAVPQAQDVIMSAGSGSAPGGKDGEAVGAITSACFSPALQKPIALGYVKRPHYEAGAMVAIARGARPLLATLVIPPFVRF